LAEAGATVALVARNGKLLEGVREGIVGRGGKAHVFVADVSTFSIGGVYLQWEPSIYFFGAGVYFDGNQFERPKDSAQYRFSNLYRSDSSVSSNVFIYQLDFRTEALSRYDCTVSIGCGFAQKIAGAATDGFVFNAPELNFNYIDLSFGAGLVFESGRMIKGQFNDFSMGNRSYIIQGLSGHPDTLYTQNTLLSTRLARGRFDATFGMNIRPGLAVQAELLPTLYQRNAIAIDSTAKISGIDWRLSLSVNDSLIPLIRYGNIYFQQTGTNVYPPRNTFISWGFNAGVGAISNPVIYGIGANAGFSLWYLDLNANNSIDPKDMIVQFSLGFYKGF